MEKRIKPVIRKTPVFALSALVLAMYAVPVAAEETAQPLPEEGNAAADTAQEQDAAATPSSGAAETGGIEATGVIRSADTHRKRSSVEGDDIVESEPSLGLVVGGAAATEDNSRQTDKKFEARWQLNPSFTYNDDRALGQVSTGQDEDAEEGYATMSVKGYFDVNFSDHWRGFASLQLYGAKDFIQDEDDTQGKIRLREAWVDWNGFSEYPGQSLRFGRERMKYYDGTWFDTEMTLVRWRFDTTLLSATAGLGEKFNSYSTDDYEVDTADQHTFRVFGHGRYQYSLNQYVEGRAMYGYKGGDDDEDEKRNLLWLYLGTDNGYYNAAEETNFNYIVSLATAFGSITTDGSSTGGATDGSESVYGFMIDSGARYSIPSTPFMLGANLAWAPGLSGHGYRQSGLQSNRSAFTGTDASFQRFNEALRPDMFNMGDLSLYLSTKLGRSMDASLVYHRFWLDDPELGFVSDLSYVAGSGSNYEYSSKYLGDGVDFVTSYYWGDIDNEQSGFTPMSYIRLKASAFRPGDAFNKDTSTSGSRSGVRDKFQARLSADLVVEW